MPTASLAELDMLISLSHLYFFFFNQSGMRQAVGIQILLLSHAGGFPTCREAAVEYSRESLLGGGRVFVCVCVRAPKGKGKPLPQLPCLTSCSVSAIFVSIPCPVFPHTSGAADNFPKVPLRGNGSLSRLPKAVALGGFTRQAAADSSVAF